MNEVTPLVGIVTSDLAAIVRGRFVPAAKLEEFTRTGIGWLPANIALTPFNGIAPNPFGSQGDLRVIPDTAARFTAHTGGTTPFDMVMGDVTELDGTAWEHCPRTLLKAAAARLKERTGLTLRVSFEQEFQLLDTDLPPAHALSFAALRRADPFASQLMAALAHAGVEPEVLIAEFGLDQFEVTCAPADPLTAADRCIAIREITRELARHAGWYASFAPKMAVDAVGNGVHIHVSLLDGNGMPATYDPDGPAGLSKDAGAFCAGIIRHLPALTALTAPSVASYFRLKPHSWSASYTWLGDREREASLRICPFTTIPGSDPARQFNIEYRAADATGNPYLGLAAIIIAGLAGIEERLAPVVACGDPSAMTEQERAHLGLVRLPETLDQALTALRHDDLLMAHLPAALVDCFEAVKRVEIAHFADAPAQTICHDYSRLY